MIIGTHRRPLLAALAVALASACTVAGAADHGYGVSLAAGVDSNPLAVQDDGPNGAFGQLSLDGFVSHSVSPTLALFVDGDLHGRLDEGPTSDADVMGALAHAGIVLTPRRMRRLSLLAAATRSLERETLIDRATGRIYEVVAGPGTDPPTVPIPERLDYDSSGLALRVRWKQTRRLGLFLDGLLERTDYRNDYGAIAGLESLDNHAWSLESGVAWTVGPRAALRLSLLASQLDYDDQPALDAQGYVAEGAQRSYRHTQARARLRLSPGERWTILVGMIDADRNDTFAGYYDYAALSGYLAVDREVGRFGLLRLYASALDLEYRNATVTLEDQGALRGNDVRTLSTRYELAVRRDVRWFVEGGGQSASSPDPIYAHDSKWALTGVEFRR